MRGSLLLILLLPVGVYSVCSEWKTWAILALDLSADTALFKLREIHHYQISGGMFIKLSEGATADISRAIITHVFHSEHTDYTPT